MKALIPNLFIILSICIEYCNCYEVYVNSDISCQSKECTGDIDRSSIWISHLSTLSTFF